MGWLQDIKCPTLTECRWLLTENAVDCRKIAFIKISPSSIAIFLVLSVLYGLIV
jgi:hypothetical protein